MHHEGRGEDPWAVLGIDESASDERIRAAYLAAVREHPPDRDPEGFERVRDAHAAVTDPRARAERLIRGADPRKPFAALLDEAPAERRRVGPGPWLRVAAGARR